MSDLIKTLLKNRRIDTDEKFKEKLDKILDKLLDDTNIDEADWWKE